MRELLNWITYHITQAKVRAKHARFKNKIHPTAYVHSEAIMGNGNYIGPFCYVGKRVSLGDANHLESHVAIGTQPEHKYYWIKGEFSKHDELAQHVWIGSGNVFREFVTVQGGTEKATLVGDKNIFLRGSHVSHDTNISDKVTVSCNVLIGGETTVMEGANLGLGAIVHQQHLIGPYAMLGMGTVVPKKTAIEPGMIYVGNPAKELKQNERGYQAAGGYDKIQDHKRRYQMLKEDA